MRSAPLIVGQELKVAVSERLRRAGEDDVKSYALRLHLPDGEELGPKTWAKVSRSDELPTLRVSLESLTPSPPSSGDSSSYASSTRSRSTSVRLLEGGPRPGEEANERESDSESQPLAELQDQTPGRRLLANEAGDFILLSSDSERAPHGK